MSTRLGVVRLLVCLLALAESWQIIIRNTADTGTVSTTITAPTSSATYDAGTSSTLTTLAGTASSDRQVTGCTWTNSLGGSGSATGSGSWSVASIALTVGDNVITVTCTNNTGGSGQDVLTVTRSGSGYTDDPAALWVSASGSGSSCTSGSPCTMATALTNVADNGVIIRNSGTYSGSINITGTNHDGITITAPAAVKNALVKTCGSAYLGPLFGITDCGTVSGTDDRPYSSSGTWTIGRNGVTVEFQRIRLAASPANGFFGVVEIDQNFTDITIAHNEIWNGGQGIHTYTSLRLLIEKNYFHNGGDYPACGQDSHGIGFYTTSGYTNATQWADGTIIRQNTIEAFEGDGVQTVGDQNIAWRIDYLIEEGNHVFNHCENGLDYKGTRFLIVRKNDIHDTGDMLINDNDADGSLDYVHSDHWMYNNILHDAAYGGIFSQDGDNTRWYYWNNLFFNLCQSPPFNCGAITNIPGGPSYVENNTFWNSNRVSGTAEVAGINWPDGHSAATANTIRNNIFYNNGQGGGARGNIATNGTSNKTIDDNHVYPSTPGVTGTNASTSSTHGFVNNTTAPYDLSLISGAPDIDVATTLTGQNADHTITIDILGNTRPFGSAWDRGAHERQSAPPAPSFAGVAWRRPQDPLTAMERRFGIPLSRPPLDFGDAPLLLLGVVWMVWLVGTRKGSA